MGTGKMAGIMAGTVKKMKNVKCHGVASRSEERAQQFADEHGDISASGDMTVDAWFDYWIENIKGDSIRPNTIRNYKERFEHNIKKCIGNMILSEVKPMHCQNVLNQMKDGYKTSTIYQTRIVLYVL